MVIIRLSRGGAKKRPFYHVIVTDSRRRRDAGNCIERIGYFNPVARGQEKRIHLNLEKVKEWEDKGAQVSDRVRSIIKELSKADKAA